METQVLIKLSAIIDKMDINAIVMVEDNQMQNGLSILNLFIRKLHKAEAEVYELIAMYKNITLEEAKKENVIPVIQELLKIEGITSFFA